MSRDLSTAVENTIEDEVVYPFFVTEMNFISDTLRFWTGIGTLVYEGVSYTGAGNLLNISSIEETSEIAAKGARITLSGIPSETLSLALSEPYQGRICTVSFGLFSKGHLLQENSSYILLESGGKIALETQEIGLTEIFSGYMDQMNINEGVENSDVELLVENKLIDLERQRVARYTSAYQKTRFPGDLGLDFVESLQDKNVVWGRKIRNE